MALFEITRGDIFVPSIFRSYPEVIDSRDATEAWTIFNLTLGLICFK